MPRKILSSINKLKLVPASLEANVIVTRFCKQHGISRSSLYRWRKVLQAGLTVLLSPEKPIRVKRESSDTRNRVLAVSLSPQIAT